MKHTKPRPKKQSVSGLPLFDFRRRITVPRTRAGQRLMHRFGLSAAFAETVAELAGFRTEAER